MIAPADKCLRLRTVPRSTNLVSPRRLSLERRGGYARVSARGRGRDCNGGSMERIWLKSYPEGVPAEIDASAVGSLGDFIKTSVEKFRDRTAFVSMGKAMSYGELDLKSRAFASYLQNVARLPNGARVALMMPNVLQYPIAAFGALRAGYVVVNCNPLYSPRELKYQLADLGAEAIVVLENFASTLEKAIEGDGGLENGHRHRGRRPIGRRQGASRQFGRAARPARGSRFPPAAGGAVQSSARFGIAATFHGDADLAGRRRLPSIHRRNHRRAEGRDADPSQHGRELTPDLRLARARDRRRRRNLRRRLAALSCVRVAGERLRAADDRRLEFSIANPRDIPALVKALRGTRFTAMPGVNTLFNALLNNQDFAKLDFSKLHLSIGGGMAVQRAVAERWQSVTGKPLIEAYG